MVCGTRLQGDVYRFYLAVGLQRADQIFRPKPECVFQQNCGLGGKILQLVTSRTPISDWQICMRKRPRHEWRFKGEAVLNLQLCGTPVDYNRSVKKSLAQSDVI